MSYCVFQINGGIGKNIAATAVCAGIKKKYPERKLIVVCGYPDVFLNNPNVHRCYAMGMLQYFYEEYIDGKDTIVFAHDPYLDNLFVKQEKHLIEVWFKMFDLPYSGEQPQLFVTDREKNFHQIKYNSDKPIFVMQTNGGFDPNGLKYSWAR